MKTRDLVRSDFPRVLQIYKEGIDTKVATFETQLPNWDNWNKSHLEICRLVVEINNSVCAWAALSNVSDREVYKGVAEISIYVSQAERVKGIGKYLLNIMINESELNNIWTLQSSIFAENIASINLHKTCGFRKIGYREKIAQLDGKWTDNVILERRSKIVNWL